MVYYSSPTAARDTGETGGSDIAPLQVMYFVNKTRVAELDSPTHNLSPDLAASCLHPLDPNVLTPVSANRRTAVCQRLPYRIPYCTLLNPLLLLLGRSWTEVRVCTYKDL